MGKNKRHVSSSTSKHYFVIPKFHWFTHRRHHFPEVYQIAFQIFTSSRYSCEKLQLKLHILIHLHTQYVFAIYCWSVLKYIMIKIIIWNGGWAMSQIMLMLMPLASLGSSFLAEIRFQQDDQPPSQHHTRQPPIYLVCHFSVFKWGVTKKIP